MIKWHHRRMRKTADLGGKGVRMGKDELALVMSGGGARAAYQVGFLRCLAHHYPDLHIPSAPAACSAPSRSSLCSSTCSTRWMARSRVLSAISLAAILRPWPLPP